MIFPEGDISSGNPSLVGLHCSSRDDIIVNSTTDGYVVLYTEEIFEEIHPSIFSESLINLLKANIPGGTLTLIEIMYQPTEELSCDCAIAVMKFDEIMIDHIDNDIRYRTSPSVQFLKDHWDEDEEDFDFSDIDEDDEDIYDVDDYESYIRDDYYEDDDDDDEYDDDDFEFSDYLPRPKKYKQNKSYGRSAFTHEKSAKRSIKRHNIIITNDKTLIKREARAIKEFIKDRYPGGGVWKDFRAELLDRWMTLLLMTKKTAKKHQKEYDKYHNKKSYSRKKDTQGRILTMAEKMFAYDPWNDSNR